LADDINAGVIDKNTLIKRGVDMHSSIGRFREMCNTAQIVDADFILNKQQECIICMIEGMRGNTERYKEGGKLYDICQTEIAKYAEKYGIGDM